MKPGAYYELPYGQLDHIVLLVKFMLMVDVCVRFAMTVHAQKLCRMSGSFMNVMGTLYRLLILTSIDAFAKQDT